MAISLRKLKPDRAVRRGGRLDEVGLHAFGLRVGLHLLAARRLKRALTYLVRPVHYWRGVEYRLVWNEAGFRPDDRVLDIGSPKLLSLYLAEKVGAEVFATDIDSYFLDEYALLRSARRLSDQALRLQVEDGRRLGFDDASFTKVYAVSVLEHIPEHGDAECMREIARVLKPGGRCLLTVPYWPVFKEKYKQADFYWAAASTSTADGRVFFQRRYDEPALFARLIEPSGLTLDRLEYIGERVLVGSRREFGDFLGPATGPLHPILSRLVHTGPARSPGELAKPLCAFIALTKPAA